MAREGSAFNIFYVDKCPTQAAQWHCDKHVRKMILETCQMLVTARVMKGDLPQGTKYHTYRMRNHPCSYWVRNDRKGFLYASELLRALCDEYTYRFGKTHATDIFYFELPEPNLKRMFPHRRRTKDVPMAVGDHPLTNDPVEVYRSYYHTKSWDLKWTKREVPFWYDKEKHESNPSQELFEEVT